MHRTGNFTAGAGTATLDGLGANGGGAHADHEHVLIDELPQRTALLSALLEDLLNPSLGSYDRADNRPDRDAMTGIEQLKPTDLSGFDGDLHASVRVANAAAVAAGVTVRRGTELSELTAMVRLFEEIWRPDASSPMSTELLRALSKSGNYVVAAHGWAEVDRRLRRFLRRAR